LTCFASPLITKLEAANPQEIPDGYFDQQRIWLVIVLPDSWRLPQRREAMAISGYPAEHFRLQRRACPDPGSAAEE